MEENKQFYSHQVSEEVAKALAVKANYEKKTSSIKYKSYKVGKTIILLDENMPEEEVKRKLSKYENI